MGILTDQGGNGMLVEDQASTFLATMHSFSRALWLYEDLPEHGLQALNNAIPLLRQQARAFIENDAFFSRLDLLQQSINNIMSAGCVFNLELYNALFEVVDAFEQVVFASVLGGDYILQTLFLLEHQRTCWQVLEAILASHAFHPVFLYYGYCHDDLDRGLLEALESLSQVGDVSLHIPKNKREPLADQEGQKSRIELKTAQPITWLAMRYPAFKWLKQARQLSNDTRLSVPSCFVSVLPAVFLSQELPRKARYEVLDDVEDWVRHSLYRAFAECFSPNGFLGRIEKAAKRVPVSDGFQDIIVEGEDLSAIPIRVSGALFAYFDRIHSQGEPIEGDPSISPDVSVSPVYLGRDLLPSRLYILETSMGTCAFDESDCLGCYQVDRDRFFQTDSRGDEWWCSFGNERVALQASWVQPLTGKKYVFDVDVLRAHNDVLIVNQGGRLYGVLYTELILSEGICGSSASFSDSVKNVWFTFCRETLFEPWLLPTECISDVFLIKDQNEPIEKERSGFYFIQLGNVSIWLDSSLVLEVLPFDSSKKIGPCLIYGVQFFHRFIHALTEFTKRFSILIPSAGGIVLECDNCVWQQDAPSLDTNTSDPLVWHRELDGKIVVSQEHKTDMLIDKENIARFVDLFWSTAP